MWQLKNMVGGRLCERVDKWMDMAGQHTEGDASVPTQLHTTPAPTRPRNVIKNALNIGYLVKKTCLLVSFYFIRFRALPVTHGSSQQNPL